MISFSASPLVDLISLHEEELEFISPQKLKAGTKAKVRAFLTNEQGQRCLVAFGVLVGSVRAARRGRLWNCVGWLTSALPFTPMLTASRDAHMRSAERVECKVRVVSPELPKFTALTVDMSRTGLQIHTRGPVPLGLVVRLRLEAQMTEWDTLHATARVAWYANRQGEHRVGLEIIHMNGESRRRYEVLERFMRARPKAQVFQLAMGNSDQWLLNTFPDAAAV